MQTSSQKLSWSIGVGVSLTTLLLYLITLAPTVLYADSGEFQFVAWLPGIAHPTGYPLYILLGWVWVHLFPIGEVAWRMNLLSAIFAAGTVGVTYWVSTQLLRLTLPNKPHALYHVTGAATALLFAVTPTFWSQAVIAEVYALHTLLIVAILGLVLYLKSNQSPLGSWQFHTLSFIIGLGLAHHRTTVLILPALLFFFLFTPKQKSTQPTVEPQPSLWRQLSLHKIASHLAIILLPLLLYLYIPYVAPTTPYATINLSETQTLTLYENSPIGFWNHLMGTVFSNEIQPEAVDVERLGLVWSLLQAQITWFGVILAVIGAIVLATTRLDIFGLLGLTFAAIVIFNMIYFIGDVFVLFLPTWLILVLWLGIGSLWLSHIIAQRFVQSKASSKEVPIFGTMASRLEDRIYSLVATTLIVMMLVALIGILATNFNQIDQSRNRTAEIQWSEILAKDLPDNAILISNDRNEIMPMWYYQYVHQLRPDLQGLFPLIVPDPAFTNVGRVLDQALLSGRPVYLIKPMEGLSLKAELTPWQELIQVTRNEAQPATVVNRPLPEAIATNAQGRQISETISLLGFDTNVTANQVLTVTLHWQVTQPLSVDYTSYVHLINTQGEGITQSDKQPGGMYYPSSFWTPGEVLRDHHQLQLPTDLPPGEYQLRVGMYFQPEPGQFIGMGGGEIVGPVKLTP